MAQLPTDERHASCSAPPRPRIPGVLKMSLSQRWPLSDNRKSQARARLAASSWGDENLVFTTPLGTPIDPANWRSALPLFAR